jgi:hypothetical protein
MVLEHIRLSVRALADREGCEVEYSQHAGKVRYSIGCGKLPPPLEAHRDRLERAVQTWFPPMIDLGNRIAQACGYSGPPGMFASNAWSAAKGQLRGREADDAMKTGRSLEAGCDSIHTELCQRGCDRGNPNACNHLYTQSVANPELARGFVTRECELRLERKHDQQMSLACSIAIGLQLKPGGSRKLAVDFLARSCAIEPQGSGCTMWALNPIMPLYDPALAARVAEGIDACEGPSCAKHLLLDTKTAGVYEPTRARRALAWLVERCQRHDEGCLVVADAFDTRAPHYDAQSARAIADEMEKGCAGSVVFVDGYRRDLVCNMLLDGYFRSTDAAMQERGGELAEERCNSPEHDCGRLANCYLHGKCGKPRDAKRAREAFGRQCDGMLARSPTMQRNSLVICQWADGTAQLPQ